jgi:Protein of unknown function (DUF2510)
MARRYARALGEHGSGSVLRTVSPTSAGSNGSAHVQPGWYPDPNDRFELRYHNGTDWTADVSTAGERFVDPHGVSPVRTDTGGRTPRATAAMVLGIVAIGIGWLPYLAVAGAVCALLAIALGLSARRAADASGSTIGASRARIGITTGAVGIALAAVGIAFTVIVARAYERFVDPNPNTAQVTSCRSNGEIVNAAGELTNLGTSSGDFTVRVAVVRAGTDNVHRTGRVELDGVAPQATVNFELTIRAALDDVECRIVGVDGPLPFGIDIPT